MKDKDSKQDTAEQVRPARRTLVKSVALGGGAYAAGESLPGQWAKPVVESVIMPAHAATTAPGDDPGAGTTPVPTTPGSAPTPPPTPCMIDACKGSWNAFYSDEAKEPGTDSASDCLPPDMLHLELSVWAIAPGPVADCDAAAAPTCSLMIGTSGPFAASSHTHDSCEFRCNWDLDIPLKPGAVVATMQFADSAPCTVEVGEIPFLDHCEDEPQSGALSCFI